MSEWWNEIPKMATTRAISPGVVPATQCLSRRCSKISKWFLPKCLSNYWLFAGTQTKWDFVYTLWEQILCLQSLLFSWMEATLVFKARHSGVCLTKIETLMWGLKPLSPGGGLLCLWYSSCLWVADLGVRVLTISFLSPSYPSHCGSFFISLIVENIFC